MKSKSIAQELEKDYNQFQQQEMKQIKKFLLIQSKGSIKAKNEMLFPSKKKRRRGGGMAELVDATDLIQLSLGRKTYQVLAFRFRETQVEEEIGDPEPNLVFIT